VVDGGPGGFSGVFGEEVRRGGGVKAEMKTGRTPLRRCARCSGSASRRCIGI
jgi:hypothetical protein